MSQSDLSQLSDDALITLLHRTYARSRKCNAEVIRILVAANERRLHLKSAHPSLFEFCVRRFGMSNGSAQRYAVAARLVTQFPELLARIERGDVHLSTLVQLRHHLTAENVTDLLERARGRSRYQIDELLAEIAPRPDAPSRMRKVPTPRTTPSVAPVERAIERPLEPRALERYRVQFNADRDTHDGILQARDLMLHTNPSGDLDTVMKYCVRAGVERLEGRRRGLVRDRGRRPAERPRVVKADSRHIPTAVRRAVFARDGARCTFRAADGHRCTATRLLELHHIVPFAKGGETTVENLCVRCRAHNRYDAESDFGKGFIEARIHAAQRKPKLRTPAGANAKRPRSNSKPGVAKGRAKTKKPHASAAHGSLNGARAPN